MSEFVKYIQAINEVIQDDKFYRTALSSVLPGHKARIFTEGKAADGSKIGTYKDGPYAKMKKKKGRNPGFVNLRNTDDMMVDYKLITVTPAKHYGFGFSNTNNGNKVDWNEERFKKKIFEPDKKDDTILQTVLDAQLKAAHQKQGINAT